MKALTGLGVSQQDKDGQSFWKKYAVFCGLMHFFVMVRVALSVCANTSSLLLSPSVSWVTCVGISCIAAL